MMGCRTGSFCKDSDGDFPCGANICDEVCEMDEKLCRDTDMQGCVTSTRCVPAADEDGCPTPCITSCPDGFLRCRTYGANKCLVSVICIPENEGPCYPSPFDPDGCPTMTDPVCNELTKFCPGGRSNNDCPEVGTCVSTAEDCPPPCHKATHHLCWEGQYLGEHLAYFCVSNTAYSHLWENVVCETICPAPCEWSIQKACAQGYDDITGCPLPDNCRPIHLPCEGAIEGSCTGEDDVNYAYTLTGEYL